MCGARASFEGVVWEAVDPRTEIFFIGAPADSEVGGVGPAVIMLWIGGGVRGYACGLTVG